MLLTRAATEAVERVYQAGYRYSKAEVLLLDLRQPGEFTDDLFAVTQPLASGRLMSALDEINDRYGRGTVRAGRIPRVPDWGDAPGDDESVFHDVSRSALDRMFSLTICSYRGQCDRLKVALNRLKVGILSDCESALMVEYSISWKHPCHKVY